MSRAELITDGLKSRIVRILRREDVSIYLEELWDVEACLKHRMGIDLGASGPTLYAAMKQLVDERRLIAYRDDGKIAFQEASRWDAWANGEPAAAGLLVSRLPEGEEMFSYLVGVCRDD